MTPQRRDRNLSRLRGLTSVIAGMSLAATGLFAGLSATKAKGTTSAPPATTATTASTTTTQQQTTTQQTTTQQQAPAVVTPSQQLPVASSGGS